MIFITPYKSEISSLSPFVIRTRKTIGRLIAATNIKIDKQIKIFVEASISYWPLRCSGLSRFDIFAMVLYPGGYDAPLAGIDASGGRNAGNLLILFGRGAQELVTLGA